MAKVRFLAALAGLVFTAGTSLAYANVNSDSLNSITGPFSDNQSEVNLSKAFDLSFLNDMFVLRDQVADVSTGENEVSENTTVAGVRTGTVDVAFTNNNGLDSGILFPTLNGNDLDHAIRVSGRNAITGPNSINENLVNAAQAINIDLQNQSDIEDFTTLDLSTGNNAVTENTTVGGVVTGDVNAAVRVNNADGRMLTGLNLGGLLGNDTINAIYGNGTTGPNSVNENILNASNAVNVQIENESVVTNDFEAAATTGNNDVSTNTTVGGVRTGDVRIDLRTVNNAF